MSTTISSLANETLSEIFQHLSNSLSVDEWYKQTLPSIRLVSRHWNEIIETFPMLWTSVLVTKKSAFQAGQLPFQSTHSRLLRSLKLPLNIHVDLHISTERDSFNKSDGFLLGEMIRSVAPRVASIELRADSSSRTIQMSILTRLSGTQMPILHSFSHTDPMPKIICGARPPDDGYFQNPSSILQYQGSPETRRIITEWGKDLYPSLTDIELVGASYNLEHVPIMRGIRRLHIGQQPFRKRPSLNQILQILSPAKDTLEVLQLEDIITLNSTERPLSEPTLVFTKLQVLSLGYFDPDVAYLFLRSVRFPALVDLTLTYTFSQSFPGNHHLIPMTLIQDFPLGQIERLALVKVVYPVDGSHEYTLPHPDEGIPEAAREVYVQALKDKGFIRVGEGHWKTSLFMLFISRFKSLKHLRIHDAIRLKERLSAYWQQGTLARLETLHFEGNQHPRGLIELLRAAEGQRKLGSKPSPLKVTVCESLENALSKEEKAELHRHIKALAEL